MKTGQHSLLVAALLSVGICVLPVLAIAEGWSIYFHWSRAGGATLAALAVWVALVTLPNRGEGSDPVVDQARGSHGAAETDPTRSAPDPG